MSGIEVAHKQSSISSVKSTVSDASSGYAIVTSCRPATKNPIPSYRPPEPPPDYDADNDVHFDHDHREKLNISGETTQPLLSPGMRTVTESSQQNKKETVVRINTSTHDVRIELSPGSASGDATFLYPPGRNPEPNDRRRQNQCTKRERCLCVALVTVGIVLVLTMVAIVLYFVVFKDS